MTLETDPNYRGGLELAEVGRHQEALECIQEYLRRAPRDAEALNDTGAILHCIGRSAEAVEHFLKARAIRGDSGEILWNLVEAYLAVGRAMEVAGLFDEMEGLGILNVDVINRTATVLLDQGEKSGAVEVLLRSQRSWPEQEILRLMLEKIRSGRPKIAFFCGGDGMGFLNDIVDFARERFEVRLFEGEDKQELHELMRWSDISWFEWCTNLAVVGSNLPKVCKSIVRLHRYEAYERWPEQVNWSNIDLLITVGNRFTRDALLRRVPNLEIQTSVTTVANGVNPCRFVLNNRDRGKNIAFLANVRMVKNAGFLLQCMQKLHFMDREYRLFFGGAFQDEVVEQYLRHIVEELGLGDVVIFDGWQGDVNGWLQDKDYIVCTSICEGHPVGVLEGMSCGLKPVVHNFPGAGDIFPSEFLFNISEEFCDRILDDSYEPQRYRDFVEQRYSLKKQLRGVNEIFTQFESELDSQSCADKTSFMSISDASPALLGSNIVI